MQARTPSDQGSTAQSGTDRNASTLQPRRPSHTSATSSVDSRPTQPSDAPSASGTANPVRELGPPRPGSSRDGDMQRSPSPAEGVPAAVKYTRTGRVSKAAKGRRIHHCDQCDKTYTRAEHLRRHQQNHKPGEYPCDVPDCGRSFFREDLLSRHKARHNDPHNPPTRRASLVGSLTSSPGAEPSFAPDVEQDSPYQHAGIAERSAPTIPGGMPQNLPTTTAQQTNSARAPRSKYIPLTELGREAQMSVLVGTGGAYQEQYSCAGQFEPSPPYSPNGYGSPTGEYTYTNGQPYFGQPQLAQTHAGYGADYFGSYESGSTSRSPYSVGSSSDCVPQWGQTLPRPLLGHFDSSSSPEDALNNDIYTNVFGEQHYITTFENGLARLMSAEERDLNEMADLLGPTASPPGLTPDLSLGATKDQRYLDAYWEKIHPLLPVMHRATFHLAVASPLLRVAVLALGAHVLKSPTDMGNARILHERCAKTLKKRNINHHHTYRICDMQAIFLIEVFSIYKSRRPPLHFSKNFVDIYRGLASDPVALNPELATMRHDSIIDSFGSQAASIVDGSPHAAWLLDQNCKQRLLLSCYILDQQHSALFGRQPTECASSISGLNLPWPKAQDQWSAFPDEQTEWDLRPQSYGESHYLRVCDAASSLASLLKSPRTSQDVFQSQLILACLVDRNSNTQVYGFHPDTEDESLPLLSSLEQSPRTNLAYHTFMLTKHTPLRDLLAVAGESWVMAEKLRLQDDYTTAQIVARRWAKGSDADEQSPVHRAIYHALQILDIHRRHPQSGLLFQEWSIYLAAVVLWARAYVISIEGRRKPRLSIPSPNTSRPPPQELELDQTVSMLIETGATTISWAQAKHVILWTKNHIEKVDVLHNCGLTNGALDVLGKLAMRGSEDGWFGA